jgi:hypothetical protein
MPKDEKPEEVKARFLFYTRLHPHAVVSSGNWCSKKSKNPVFSGVFHLFLL